MEIKYIGPRATINQHGVTFKEGKEDKYVYLKDAMQILRAIKHEYKKDVLYHYDIKLDEISNEDIYLHPYLHPREWISTFHDFRN